MKMRRRRWKVPGAWWRFSRRLYQVGDITVCIPRLGPARRLVRVRIWTEGVMQECVAWIEQGRGRSAGP